MLKYLFLRMIPAGIPYILEEARLHYSKRANASFDASFVRVRVQKALNSWLEYARSAYEGCVRRFGMSELLGAVDNSQAIAGESEDVLVAGIADLEAEFGKRDKIPKARGSGYPTPPEATWEDIEMRFIDGHTHTLEDLSDANRKTNEPYLMQGVTTVVTGNDGGGPSSIGDTLRKWEQQGIGTNAALLAGFGTARRRVLGASDAQPTAEQLEEMKKGSGAAEKFWLFLWSGW